MKIFLLLLIAASAQAMDAPGLAKRLKAAQGWQVKLFASGLPQARALAQGADGAVYVGSKTDKIYAFKDGQRYVLAKGLNSPIGLDIKGKDLYVSSVDEIFVLKNIEGNLAKPPKPELFADLGTPEGWHGGKVIRFGPDGKLHVPVGMPCNVCVRKEPYGRLNVLENGKLRALAHGIRNSVGYDWHPDNGELWFTDNGRDNMGDDIPPCELNRVRAPGLNFGFPYRHGDGIADPEFGRKAGPDFKFEAPAWKFRAHNAPLGMRFAKGGELRGNILACLHGSWNRSKKDGYKVVLLRVKDGKVLEESDFLTGFLQGQRTLGRPVDVLELKDGSWLVSDDDQGALYRISKKP